MGDGLVRPVLSPGDELLLRYRYNDGSLQAALPMRVVLDSADQLVAWLMPGTPIMYWALADGRDPRAVPLARRFRQPLTTASRFWQGNGTLRVMPAHQPYQVLHFWDDAGAFAGWYVNFESRKTRRGARLDAVARATGQQIIDQLSQWPAPIGDWRSFSCPRDWAIPMLPEDWRS